MPRTLPATCWLAVLAIATTTAAAQTPSDSIYTRPSDYVAPERDKTTAALPEPMPAIPADSALKAFELGTNDRNRFGVDPASILVFDHRLIQYTIVITSPQGVRNIGYEALDCSQGRGALLAIGRDSHGWSPVTKPSWQPVASSDRLNGHRRVLARLWCAGDGTADGNARGLLRRFDQTPEYYRF